MAAKLPKGRHHSAVKEVRKTRKRYLHQRVVKARIHSLVKEWGTACKEKNQNRAQELLSHLYALYDKAAKRKIIHKNAAARKKSHLTKRFKTIFATTG